MPPIPKIEKPDEKLLLQHKRIGRRRCIHYKWLSGHRIMAPHSSEHRVRTLRKRLGTSNGSVPIFPNAGVFYFLWLFLSFFTDIL